MKSKQNYIQHKKIKRAREALKTETRPTPDLKFAELYEGLGTNNPPPKHRTSKPNPFKKAVHSQSLHAAPFKKSPKPKAPRLSLKPNRKGQPSLRLLLKHTCSKLLATHPLINPL